MTGAAEWQGDLGKTWHDHLSGLEATLAPINHVLSEALDLKAGNRIADIGCGGGAYSNHLGLVGPLDIQVEGYDISQDLIQAARARNSSSSIDFICMDVSNGILRNNLFDHLTSRFGIMFFEDDRAAFANLRSWLKQDGRIVFAVWDNLTANPWMGVIRDVVNKFFDISPEIPGQPGPFRYSEVDRFLAILEQAGFNELNTTSWDGTLKLGGGLSAADAAEFGLSAFWREFYFTSPDNKRAHKQLTDVLAEHEIDREVSMGASIHIVTGQNPRD